MQLTAEQIAAALGGKPSGKGHWMCRCPAHEEKTPSFRVSDRDGRILLKCFGGCQQREVIAALRSRGLWFPETEQQKQIFKQQQQQRDRARLRIVKALADQDRRTGRAAKWSEADKALAAQADRVFPHGVSA